MTLKWAVFSQLASLRKRGRKKARKNVSPSSSVPPSSELREESTSQRPMARTKKRPKKGHSNDEAQAKKKRKIETSEAGKPAEELEQSKRPDHSEVPGQKIVTGQSEDSKQVETVKLPKTPKERKRSKQRRIELGPGKELFFSGQAWLKVEKGAVYVGGACVDASRALLLIAADVHLGGALLIKSTADPEHPVIPRAAKRCCAIIWLADAAGDDGKPGSSSYRATKKKGGMPMPRQLPASWDMVAQTLAVACRLSGGDAPPRIATVGGPRQGKSTFGRLLVNTLLNTQPCVAYLDTDLGQPEFTVPGLVSLSLLRTPLTGPPHLHQRWPECSHFIGDTAAQSEPQLYMRAVRSLYQWYCQNAEQVDEETGRRWWPPLVVNTPGHIHGMGLEVLTEVLQAIWPSHVVMLQTDRIRRNLPYQPFWIQDCSGTRPTPQLFLLPSSTRAVAGDDEASISQATPDDEAIGATAVKPLPAREVRGLAWLAFAKRCKSNPDKTFTSWDAAAYTDVANQLAAQSPYAVSFADVTIQVLHAAVPSTRLALALNCAVVGLAKSSDAVNELSTAARRPPECFGVGIVRGIDASKGLIYILTDAESGALEQVDVLQVGKWDMPTALLQTAQHLSPYLCQWSIATEGSGSGIIKSRNNLPRLSRPDMLP